MTQLVPHTRRWYQKPLFWVFAVLLAALLAFLAPRVYRLPGLIGQARTEATYWKSVRSGGLKTLARAGAVDEMQAHLDAARRLTAAARRDWNFALGVASAFGWLPRVGGDLAALPHLVDMGQALLDGGATLFESAKPGLEAFPQGAGKAMAALATGVQAQSAVLAEANEMLDRAADSWNRVNVKRLSPRLAQYAPVADEALPALAAAPELLRALPELLGADGLKRYLILAQNSDEIRATGGFISGVGVLEVEKGEIKSLVFGDSYSILDLTRPHPIPPAALETHMLAQILLFRDANWWADFPTSAQEAWDLYEQDTGRKVDGIIAIDTPALQLLVGATEPLRLEEYDDTITADNVIERIQHYWASPVGGPGITSENPKWWGLRKKFMGVLAQAAMERVLQNTADLDAGKLGKAMLSLLRERHLLVYVPPAEDIFHELKLDGSIVPADGDYLFVVDSNVGFNKVNPVIQQEIAYTVNLADSTATLSIRYAHGSQVRLDTCVHESRYGDTYQDMMDRCYWNYIRVFVPSGAELLGREGVEDGDLAEPEQGKAVWDGLMVLPPGESREVVFHYRLPEHATDSASYQLYVQKQSGTWALPIHVEIWDGERLLGVFQTDVKTDRVFDLP